jgi:hypothetical protein
MIITISERFIRVRMPRPRRSSSRMRMFASAAQESRHRYPFNRQFSRRSNSWFVSSLFICLAQPEVDDDANVMASGSGSS